MVNELSVFESSKLYRSLYCTLHVITEDVKDVVNSCYHEI